MDETTEHIPSFALGFYESRHRQPLIASVSMKMWIGSLIGRMNGRSCPPSQHSCRLYGAPGTSQNLSGHIRRPVESMDEKAEDVFYLTLMLQKISGP